MCLNLQKIDSHVNQIDSTNIDFSLNIDNVERSSENNLIAQYKLLYKDQPFKAN